MNDRVWLVVRLGFAALLFLATLVWAKTKSVLWFDPQHITRVTFTKTCQTVSMQRARCDGVLVDFDALSVVPKDGHPSKDLLRV